MSNSSLVQYTRISPNRSTRASRIDTITIHCMAAPLSIETCGNVFSTSSAQASSNYGIGPDGRIGMYVEEKDRSWATSNRANDNRAVTIEVACERVHPYKVTKAAYNSLIKLCADICRRNGIKQLVWSPDRNTRVNHWGGANMTVHRDYANKACPGDYLFNLHPQIAKDVNAILNGTANAKKEYGTKTEEKKFKLLKGVYLRKEPKTGNAQKVKFSKLDKDMKERCKKDKDGYAIMTKDKVITRHRKYVDKQGNKWFKLGSGYWISAVYDGDKKVKEV